MRKGLTGDTTLSETGMVYGSISTSLAAYSTRLVIPALEWSYEAKAPDVQASFLERAAEWLVLRHHTLWIIDGTGPEALPQGLNQREVPSVNGKEPEEQQTGWEWVLTKALRRARSEKFFSRGNG